MITRIAEFSLVNFFKEQGYIPDFVGFIKFLCERTFFFGSRGMSVASRRTPPVVQHEHCVVALFEVFIDQRLRTARSTNGVLPTDRMKLNVLVTAMMRGTPFQRITKPFPFLRQTTWGADKNTILRNQFRHWKSTKDLASSHTGTKAKSSSLQKFVRIRRKQGCARFRSGIQRLPRFNSLHAFPHNSGRRRHSFLAIQFTPSAGSLPRPNAAARRRGRSRALRPLVRSGAPVDRARF